MPWNLFGADLHKHTGTRTNSCQENVSQLDSCVQNNMRAARLMFIFTFIFMFCHAFSYTITYRVQQQQKVHTSTFS